MSDMIYDMPPVLQGSTQRQLQELRNYLVRQARRQGQQASGQSNAAGTGTVVQIGGKGGAGGGASPQDMEDAIAQAMRRAAALKALIIKTAEDWGQELQQTETELIGRIEAIDGTYVYIRYSANQEGDPMTVTQESDSAWMGICSTMSETAPTDPTEYTWVRIIGRTSLTLQIISTHGNIFKNGNISTTLSVVVWYGEEDITDSFNANEFRWTRVSADTVSDTTWNQAHYSGTKTVTITGSDVNGKATFHCELLDET